MAGLVFISHNTPDGRTGSRNRTLISAHTLGHNRKLKYKARSQGTDKLRTLAIQPNKKLGTRLQRSEWQALSVAVESSEQVADDAPLDVDLLRTPEESLVIAAVPKGPIICGQDGEDVQSIGRWYFLDQLQAAHASYFRHAHNYWTNGLWEMARANKPMFAVIAALAAYREVALARLCSESSYVELKGRIIFHIGKDLSKRHTKPDPLTLVAIAVLAYMDVRDAHFDAARLHLLALRNLVNINEMTTDAWLACNWVDLRFALLTGQPPLLPYHIPPPFRQSHACRVSVNLRTVQRASKNVANCPKTEFLDHHSAFDLFNKLHGLCLCSDQLLNSSLPPFGQIYDLEYALRVMQSQVSAEKTQSHNTAASELVVLAVQLHVWMASRFWTPQRRESHLAFVSRASLILDSLDDILLLWNDLASPESLLWVLFTMIAMMRIYGDAKLPRMLDLLHSTLTTLGIYRHQDFSAKLTEWPWISDWHPVQTVHVWTTLTDRFDDLTISLPDACGVALPNAPREPPQRLFLGGLEYFDSL